MYYTYDHALNCPVFSDKYQFIMPSSRAQVASKQPPPSAAQPAATQPASKQDSPKSERLNSTSTSPSSSQSSSQSSNPDPYEADPSEFDSEPEHAWGSRKARAAENIAAELEARRVAEEKPVKVFGGPKKGKKKGKW